MGAFDVEAPHWGRIPAVTVTGAPVVNADGSVSLATDAGPLRIAILESGVRLRLGPDTRDYGIVVREPATLDARVEAIDGGTRIAAGERVLDVGHVPLSFSFSVGGRRVQSSPSDAHFVRRFRLPPFARIGDAWFVSLELGPDTPVYGLGEKWGRLDRRGQLVRSYNHDALGVNAEVSYKNAPFAWSPEGWGVFVHTVAPVVHGVGYAPWSQRAYGLKVDEPALDLFLFDGTNGAQLLGQYTALTGRAPVPPLWSLGLILSKAYYRTADEILAVAREVRARGMPCDTITFDGRAWQDTDTRFAFEWDPARYPDPQAVVAQLKALDFRVCVWEYPLVSVLNPLFGELAARGWLLRDARTGEAYRYQWDLEPFGKVLTPLPESGLVDFTNADAYAYWRDRHRELFELGVDMIKPDFGEQVEPHMVASDGARGDALHNVYALLYNRCVHEAAGLYARDGGFLFSRSAWSGSQRYPSQWGGDPQADWGGLAASIRGGLSWGMTGAPYYATDVGGFYGDQRDPLLYVRWAQASVFSAHMRLHGIGAREPWSYGPEAERAAMTALELRYRLLPYLWRVVEQAAATGLPVQRAMVLACPEEPESWGFDHQFFCGDDLLVAPCLEPSGRVRVYLPEGDWCRFPRGDTYAGGRTHEFFLALDELAVFARRGTEIPLGAAVQHTGATGAAPRVVEVWRAA
ncbi:MAG: alpha-xylosidase [Steroidobacteraceae bacterium]|nr:alpha-xylosidase [Steroidobacteraceae bacterium]